MYIKTDFNPQTGDYQEIDNAEQCHLYRSVSPDDFGGIITNNIHAVLIQLTIIIIAMTLLYGLILSSFEKREKDYTLLRNIGTTQRQIYYIIFIQVIILSCAPIIILMILIGIITFLVPLFISFLMYVNFQVFYGLDLLCLSQLFLVILYLQEVLLEKYYLEILMVWSFNIFIINIKNHIILNHHILLGDN